MSRYDDVHPNDIDPETNRPYAGYSSPALDTSFHDGEMDVEDDPQPCSNPRGHSWVVQEGDEISGEGRSYCEWCGADGDA